MPGFGVHYAAKLLRVPSVQFNVSPLRVPRSFTCCPGSRIPFWVDSQVLASLPFSPCAGYRFAFNFLLLRPYTCRSMRTHDGAGHLRQRLPIFPRIRLDLQRKRFCRSSLLPRLAGGSTLAGASASPRFMLRNCALHARCYHLPFAAFAHQKDRACISVISAATMTIFVVASACWMYPPFSLHRYSYSANGAWNGRRVRHSLHLLVHKAGGADLRAWQRVAARAFLPSSLVLCRRGASANAPARITRVAAGAGWQPGSSTCSYRLRTDAVCRKRGCDAYAREVCRWHRCWRHSACWRQRHAWPVPPSGRAGLPLFFISFCSCGKQTHASPSPTYSTCLPLDLPSLTNSMLKVPAVGFWFGYLSARSGCAWFACKSRAAAAALVQRLRYLLRNGISRAVPSARCILWLRTALGARAVLAVRGETAFRWALCWLPYLPLATSLRSFSPFLCLSAAQAACYCLLMYSACVVKLLLPSMPRTGVGTPATNWRVEIIVLFSRRRLCSSQDVTGPMEGRGRHCNSMPCL